MLPRSSRKLRVSVVRGQVTAVRLPTPPLDASRAVGYRRHSNHPVPVRLLLFVLGGLVIANAAVAGQAPGLAAAGAEALPFAFDGPPAPAPPAVVSRDAEGRTTIRAVRVEPLRVDGALD